MNERELNEIINRFGPDNLAAARDIVDGMSLEDKVNLLAEHVLDLRLAMAEQQRLNEQLTKVIAKLTFKMTGVDPYTMHDKLSAAGFDINEFIRRNG